MPREDVLGHLMRRGGASDVPYERIFFVFVSSRLIVAADTKSCLLICGGHVD